MFQDKLGFMWICYKKDLSSVYSKVNTLAKKMENITDSLLFKTVLKKFFDFSQ